MLFTTCKANARAQRQRQNFSRVLEAYRLVFDKYPATQPGRASLMRAGELMTLLFRWTGREGDLNQAQNYYQRLVADLPQKPPRRRCASGDRLPLSRPLQGPGRGLAAVSRGHAARAAGQQGRRGEAAAQAPRAVTLRRRGPLKPPAPFTRHAAARSSPRRRRPVIAMPTPAIVEMPPRRALRHITGRSTGCAAFATGRTPSIRASSSISTRGRISTPTFSRTAPGAARRRGCTSTCSPRSSRSGCASRSA